MDVYVFVYHVEPTKGSPEFGIVGGAHADVWVYESSRNAADIKAQSYLMDLSWQVIATERELMITDEQIPHFRADAQANYRQAKECGISAFFAAHPPVDRDDDVVEIRSIKSPLDNLSTNNH